MDTSMPLAPFEHYALADDSPAHPMTYVLRLGLSGRIERGAFEAALQEVVGRHPLLRSTLQPDASGRPQWVVHETAAPRIEWLEADAPEFPTRVGIDLCAETGLHVGVRPTAAGNEVMLHFHHACCDGKGAFQVIEELLIAYRNHVAASRPIPLPELVGSALAKRGHVDAGRRRPGRSVIRVLRSAGRAVRFFLTRPAPLAVPDDERTAPRGESPLPGVCAHCFSREETEQLDEAAGRAGVTVNDLLLRDLFLTIVEWNHVHGSKHRGPIRIGVPLDMRGRVHERMPAANVVGISFVEMPPRSCLDVDALLRRVHGRMEVIKTHRFGTLLRVVRLLAGCPWTKPTWLVRSDRCYATTLLSNVGSLFGPSPIMNDEGLLEAGGLRLERIEIVLPVKARTPATFVVHEYAGRANLAMSYDRRRFDSDVAAALFDEYVQRLQRSLSEAMPLPA